MSDGKRQRRSSSQVTGSGYEKTGAQYHCDYCRKDISNVVRIRCAECADFDLCLECFSVGVEVYPHKNYHNYRVMDHVTTPIFEEDWGADEEVLLLEAIETYGLGNWSDVADHVGTKKSKAKCEQHYYDVYLNSSSAPLPDLKAELLKKGGSKRETNSKDWVKQAQMFPKLPLADSVGYIPKRGDFDVEYDNDAELILADMEFKPEDTDIERALKLKVMQIYNSKLDARAERKQFIMERGFLEGKDKKMSKEEREIEEKMRPFARFQTAADHEAFIKGLAEESALRARIEYLQKLRHMGIRTYAEAQEYEGEKKKRESSTYHPSSSPLSAILDQKKRKYTELASSKGSGSGSSGKGSTKRVNTGTLDISNADCVSLLSINERKLCERLRLLPKHYLAMKKTIMKEAMARGYLDKTEAKNLIHVDFQKTSDIMDFFVTAGWITNTKKNTSQNAVSI